MYNFIIINDIFILSSALFSWIGSMSLTAKYVLYFRYVYGETYTHTCVCAYTHTCTFHTYAYRSTYRAIYIFVNCRLYPYITVDTISVYIRIYSVEQIVLQDVSVNTGTSMDNYSLQWRLNGCNNVSNHQPYDCFLNRLFRHRLKKASKLRVTGRCAGNSPEAGEFPAQMASNVENVSIWWRHHVGTQVYIIIYVHIFSRNIEIAEEVNTLRSR